MQIFLTPLLQIIKHPEIHSLIWCRHLGIALKTIKNKSDPNMISEYNFEIISFSSIF